jgi:hypothetical protein
VRFLTFGRKYANFDDVMRQAPGPSPWYFRRDPPQVSGRTAAFRWCDAAADFPGVHDAIGKTLLRDASGRVRLMLDFHCYARQVCGNRLLIWYAVDRNEQSPANAFIHLRLFDVDSLPVVDEAADTCASMKRDGHQMWPPGDHIAHSTIPLTLEDGTHTFSFPEALQSVDELLVLAHAVRNGRSSNFHDEMHLCVYVLRPAESSIAVIPQDWFNRGGYDYGYQWVTRVARDPQTHRIFGEGIRIRSFVLNSTGRKIEHWR